MTSNIRADRPIVSKPFQFSSNQKAPPVFPFPKQQALSGASLQELSKRPVIVMDPKSSLDKEQMAELWLMMSVMHTPHLKERERLQQITALLEIELYVLNHPDGILLKQTQNKIQGDPKLIEATSRLLHAIKYFHNEQAVLDSAFQDIFVFKTEREYYLHYLKNKLYPPFSSVMFKNITDLLSIFELKDSADIKSLLLRHDTYSTFLTCLEPLIKLYLAPTNSKKYVQLNRLYERVFAFFYDQIDTDQMIRSINAQIHSCLKEGILHEYLQVILEMPPEKKLTENLLSETTEPLSFLNSVKKQLYVEKCLFQNLRQLLHSYSTGYQEHIKFLHLKFRNSICIWNDSKSNRLYLYPVTEEEWNAFEPNDLTKKIKLCETGLPDSEMRLLERKQKTHFLYLNPSSKTKTLASLKEESKNLHSIYESMEASLKLDDPQYASIADKGLGKQLETSRQNHPVILNRLTPFLSQLWAFFDEFRNANPSRSDNLDHLGPELFCPIFFAHLGSLLMAWKLQTAQKTLAEYVDANIQRLSNSQEKADLKIKKSEKPSIIKKAKQAVEVAKKVLITSPKQKREPLLNKDLMQAAMAHRLHKTTPTMSTANRPRIENTLGKDLWFTKAERVLDREVQPAVFEGPLSREQLKSHIFHITHPLVDRFVHLGIKSTRKGQNCIYIPATITFDEETFHGVIGYTFGDFNHCYHRFFSKKIPVELQQHVPFELQNPLLGTAYPTIKNSTYVEQHHCRVVEDTLGNVTFKHTQTAIFAGKTYKFPVTIQIFKF